MNNKNYYDILGVRMNASWNEIEIAYKGRRSQYHPDKYARMDEATIAWSTAKMQEINMAYEKLKDINDHGQATHQKNDFERDATEASAKTTQPDEPKSTTSTNPTDTKNSASDNNTELDLPLGVRGWSWGGFFIAPIWAIPNKTWIGLLALVPIIGLPIPFILGFKGREWAWRNREWENVAHFQRVQKGWTRWGLAIYFISFAIILAALLAPMVMRHEDDSTEKMDAETLAMLEAPVRIAQDTPILPVAPSNQIPDITGLIFANEETVTPISTIGGTLSKIRLENQESRVTFNDKILFNGDDAQWQTPLKRFSLSPQQDVILVASSGGRGNSCESLLFFLVINPNSSLTWTQEFGTCVHGGKFVQHGNKIELIVPKIGGKTVYTFNGQTLTEDGMPMSQTIIDSQNPSK